MSIDYISYLEIALKIFLSVLFGAIIGHDRETKNRPAGFRTYTLVCVSSAAIMILSELIFKRYNISNDPTRLGAQVISGISFLGAGTIIHHGDSVQGLTTAAGLWAVMTIGLIIGSGFYFLGALMFIAVYVVLVFFAKLPTRISGESNPILELEIKILNNPKAIGDISLCINKNYGKILDINFVDYEEKDLENVDEIIKVKIMIKITTNIYTNKIIDEIKSIEGVINVEKI